VPEFRETIDVVEIVERARSLWRDARDRANALGVELFAKAAVRRRVARDLQPRIAASDSVYETGLAVRLFSAGSDNAGFAATSGLSSKVVRWAVDAAGNNAARVTATAPAESDPVAPARWDLDPATPHPSLESLTAALEAHPELEWIEAGTTVEVIIGAGGWFAARRRLRLWALVGGPDGRLVAQRGIDGWERLLDSTREAEPLIPSSKHADSNVLELSPEAAAPLVAALVAEFHIREQSAVARFGRGWDVVDDPTLEEGLSGGTFDDVGFPAEKTILAENGIWVGRLGGPGTFRRNSYREPPVESACNLVMPAGAAASTPAARWTACRCRVLRISANVWVLGLESPATGRSAERERRWIRARPQAIVGACSARLGASRVTSEGPSVPSLIFDGL